MREFPFSTDVSGHTPTPHVDNLDAEDLRRLNRLLPWRCFTLDSQGRKFGKAASLTKRGKPQTIPDRRITELDRRLPLQDLSVLEIGCFEGIHTVALAGYGAHVTAIDSRIENVAKTLVRSAAFGFNPQVFKCDVEQPADLAQLVATDVTIHIGVLYHLADPVIHLKRLLPLTRQSILLDTHYATPQEADRHYVVDGVSYPYKHYREGGRGDFFAGMFDHAKWLTLDTLKSLLQSSGFTDIDVAQLREERNGHRVLIYANRTHPPV
ncbi:methyltransferase domain-containing protein [Polaromonas sp. YR568]|uniref:class I SAM-dependent methyltransferase n=1 Tax=Polaromonas sp. YR568 TaxID=1855301 RepID=UPI003137F5F0